jgi:hypothetical protein
MVDEQRRAANRDRKRAMSINEIVLEYLSTLEKWDVFVDLIAGVDNSTRIFNAEKYKGRRC